MARHARLHAAGGWYHVYTRGHNREAIFGDNRDREHFLELLARMRELHGVRVRAYCLMDNHYHLLLTTPDGNLSRAVQWLNGSYAIWHNRRHDRSGHLFGERFKAVLLENGARGLEVSTYIHINPVATVEFGLGKKAKAALSRGIGPAPAREEVQRRLAGLRSYRWSSYRACAGYAKAPEWLDHRALLTRACRGGIEEQSAAYRRQVEERIRHGTDEDLWSQVRWGLVLGSERFARKVRGRIRITPETVDRRELSARRSFPEIVAMVERFKGEPWKDFRDRYGDWGRDLVLWAGRRFCGMRVSELGEAAGGIADCAVSLAVCRLQERSRSERALARAMKVVESKCKL